MQIFGLILALLVLAFSSALSGCAGTANSKAAPDAPVPIVDFEGLRVPDPGELVPSEVELQWNNMRLYGACSEATRVGQEAVMLMWYMVIWSEVKVDATCAKLLTAKDEGKALAQRIEIAGGSAKLSKMCHRTDRLVIDTLGQRLFGGQFPEDGTVGLKRSNACARLAQ